MYGLTPSNPNYTFITEIKDIIYHYNLIIPKEDLQEYIKATDLIVEELKEL